jgi:hypothetical protein
VISFICAPFTEKAPTKKKRQEKIRICNLDIFTSLKRI